MKKNNLFFCILLLSIGCTKSKNPPSLFSHLEKKAEGVDQVAQRYLAAAPANKCLKDVFSVSLLQAEIKELEKKYTSGTKVEGTWRHLNLADLPIPQASFLKSHGDKLGDLNNPDAYDFSSCRDVPCLYNKIYEKEDSVAGYVHYLWYLRMGNYLAASNKVHESLVKEYGTYNGKQFPVSAYLYREPELYGFWRLSHMLKAPHTNISRFKEIYRVPQGESFDTEVEERKNGGGGGGETCGKAYSTGEVILQDLCMRLYSDWETGNFYDSVLHEITHQLDYHQGREMGKTYRSSEKDYLKVSKFALEEYKDDKGKTKRKWTHLPGIKVVTLYAASSAAENFAETIALFRVDATLTKENISDDHWNYVSKNYFDGGDFGKETLIKKWVKDEETLLSQLAFKAVGDCSSAKNQTASTYYKKTDFSTSVVPTMLNCLGAKASEISLEVRSKIKVTQPDGCGYLREVDTQKLWEPTLKPVLAGLMDKYLREHQTDGNYFKKIQAFIDDIDDRTISNEAYLSCSEISSEETCYNEAVIRLSRDNLASLNLPDSHAQDLAEMYLSSHSLDDSEAYFNSYYKAFVSSNKEKIDAEADDLFMRCKAASLSDEASPQGSLFSVSNGYMISSMYNCINADFPDAAKEIVRNLSVDEMKVTHPKEEKLLYNEIVPELRKSLESIYLVQKADEAKAIEEFISDDGGQLRKLLIGDFSWVKNGLSTESIFSDCQSWALKKLDFPLRYQTRLEAFGSFTRNGCMNIEQSSEFKKWRDESKKDFEKNSLVGLETIVLELAKAQADRCLIDFPNNTQLNRVRFKKRRESCLTDKWSELEAASVQRFSSDPAIKAFNIDMDALKQSLGVNRRRLQLRVIQQKF